MKRWANLAIPAAVLGGLIAAAAPASAQDAAKGATVFRACRACHTVGPTARNKAGPTLNGVVGRKAASVSGFEYSEAMNEAAGKGLVWTEANLKAYLKSPDAFLPRGVMAFAGVKNDNDLNDLIAFLKTQK